MPKVVEVEEQPKEERNSRTRWKCCRCGSIHHYRPSDNRCKSPLCQQVGTLEKVERQYAKGS